MEQLAEAEIEGALPIHLAAMTNTNVEITRAILRAGGLKQLSAKDDDGSLPLHLAAGWNNAEVVRLLLQPDQFEQAKFYPAAALRAPSPAGSWKEWQLLQKDTEHMVPLL